MRMYDLSPKESQRAGQEAVQNWQYRFKKQVPRLEKDGFVPVVGDEAFFIHDTVSGRKYWSPRGKRIAVPYTGSHRSDMHRAYPALLLARGRIPASPAAQVFHVLFIKRNLIRLSYEVVCCIIPPTFYSHLIP